MNTIELTLLLLACACFAFLHFHEDVAEKITDKLVARSKVSAIKYLYYLLLILYTIAIDLGFVIAIILLIRYL